jgi:hypothetical protein
MPSKPVASPLQPKKMHCTTRDDEPIDDYGNAIHSKQQEKKGLHQASDKGNVSAACRVGDAPGGPHEKHIGNMGSRNRSTSGIDFLV